MDEIEKEIVQSVTEQYYDECIDIVKRVLSTQVINYEARCSVLVSVIMAMTLISRRAIGNESFDLMVKTVEATEAEQPVLLSDEVESLLKIFKNVL